MNCKQKYKVYKKICENTLGNLLCDNSDVLSMNHIQLTAYSRKVNRLYDISFKCYTLREEYKYECIEPEKRNKAHDDVIDDIKQLNAKCGQKIQDIQTRFNELAIEFEKLEKQQKILQDNIRLDTPAQEIHTLNLVEKKIKKRPKKKKNSIQKQEEEEDIDSELLRSLKTEPEWDRVQKYYFSTIGKIKSVLYDPIVRFYVFKQLVQTVVGKPIKNVTLRDLREHTFKFADVTYYDFNKIFIEPLLYFRPYDHRDYFHDEFIKINLKIERLSFQLLTPFKNTLLLQKDWSFSIFNIRGLNLFVEDNTELKEDTSIEFVYKSDVIQENKDNINQVLVKAVISQKKLSKPTTDAIQDIKRDVISLFSDLEWSTSKPCQHCKH